jgi:transporter family protein
MKALYESWQFWALLSAVFAALTAVFAKLGVAQIHPDYATLIRTLVVVCVLALIVAAKDRYVSPAEIEPAAWMFLVLSGLGTGASWLCYFRALQLGEVARVQPVDKLSVVLVAVFGAVFLGEKLSSLNWFGVALIGAGAVLVAYK